MTLIVPEAKNIISLNKYICNESGHIHQLLDRGEGKIESALHSAFYPGSYPFHAGGVARLLELYAFT